MSWSAIGAWIVDAVKRIFTAKRDEIAPPVQPQTTALAAAWETIHQLRTEVDALGASARTREDAALNRERACIERENKLRTRVSRLEWALEKSGIPIPATGPPLNWESGDDMPPPDKPKPTP